MKQRLKLLGIYIGTFSLSLLFSCVYFWSFFSIFDRFGVLDASKCTCLATVFGVVLSCLILVYIIVWVNSSKKTKLDNWLSLNCPKLLLYHIISSITFISIKSEIIWSFEEMKDTVSLEWTIFGLSVTIFLVWNVVILQYLKDKKPKKINDAGLLQKRRFIKDKTDFYHRASVTFNTITLLTINLFVLIVTTAIVYIIKDTISLWNQNIVIFCFYFCTNTIIQLFLDIVQPLNEDKKSILKDTKVSNDEIKIQNEIDDQIGEIITTWNTLEKVESIDEEQKN